MTPRVPTPTLALILTALVFWGCSGDDDRPSDAGGGDVGPPDGADATEGPCPETVAAAEAPRDVPTADFDPTADWADPRRPAPEACPTGWLAREEMVSDGLRTYCDPWPEGRASCVDDAMQWPGSTEGCRAPGRPCPPEGANWAEALPADAVYFDSRAAEPGQGTVESPYASLRAAVDEAEVRSASVVAVARGEHVVDPIVLDAAVALQGACAAETILVAAEPSEASAFIALTSGNASFVDLTIRPGARVGIAASGQRESLAVSLAGVRIAGGVGGSILLESGGAAVTGTLVDVWLDGIRPAGDRPGVAVVTDGADLQMTNVVVEDAVDAALLSLGGSVVLNNVAALDVRGDAGGLWGAFNLLDVSAELDGVVVERAEGPHAVEALGSTTLVGQGLFVVGPRGPDTALVAGGQASVAIEAVRFAELPRISVFAGSEATIDLAHVTASDINTDETSFANFQVQSDARLSLERVHVADFHGLGVWSTSDSGRRSQVTVVDGTFLGAAGQVSRLTLACISAENADLVLTRVDAQQCPVAGVELEGATGTLRHVSIARVQPGMIGQASAVEAERSDVDVVGFRGVDLVQTAIDATEGSDLVLVGIQVEGVARNAAQPDSVHAMVYASESSVDIRDARLSSGVLAGIWASEAPRVEVHDVLVADVRAARFATIDGAAGVLVDSQAAPTAATLERISVASIEGAGLLLSTPGPSVARDVQISDVSAGRFAGTEFGAGIMSFGALEGERIAVEEHRNFGILVSGGRLDLTDVHLRNGGSGPADGRFGSGIEITGGTTGRIERLTVADTHFRGLGVGGTDTVVELADLRIERVEPAECASRSPRPPDCFAGGAGMSALDGARIEVEGFIVSDAELAGIQGSFGTSIRATRGRIRNNVVGLQTNDPNFRIEDLDPSVCIRDQGNLRDFQVATPEDWSAGGVREATQAVGESLGP